MTLPTDVPGAGRLDRRVALVTGSSAGIGEAIARRFANEGAQVVMHALEMDSSTEQSATSLGGALAIGDISKPDDVKAIVATAVEAFGGLDILVNNAGTTRFVPHADVAGADLATWRHIFEVNVFGTWMMIQECLPYLEQRDGASIINISALAGSTCTGSSIPYAVSKGAIDHMTKLVARVAGPNVRVNAIAPGLIDTGWTEQLSDVRSRVSDAAPLGRAGVPQDVADVALSLATAQYVTGQTITVDGGVSLVAVTSDNERRSSYGRAPTSPKA